MAATQNDNNGFLKIRWKLISSVGSLVVALSIIFGCVISYARSSTMVKLKCDANEKRIEKFEGTLDEMSRRQERLERGVETANTNLEWIKKELNRGRRL